MSFLKDRHGDWSQIKIAALAISLAPGLWLAGRIAVGDMPPLAVMESIRFTGRWGTRLLVLTLLVTPARRLFNAPQLLAARRTLGVAAGLYIVAHFALYIVNQGYDIAKVASEIALRTYLTIGFVALLMLVALLLTSTDSAVRRLGGARWTALHRAIYLIVPLALLHYLMQVKLEATPAIWLAGLAIWLGLWRLAQRRLRSASGGIAIGISVLAAVLTALGEAGWYAASTGVDAGRVLMANTDFTFEIRPAWWVLAAGLALTAVSEGWRRFDGAGGREMRPARARS